mmetsp:Transcript_3871/g.3238  ORF Transcript_3871/g.3238 Transcript_3871/m.3238 type:complete len:99 (+) Transcript_3871:2010-2306(+)
MLLAGTNDKDILTFDVKDLLEADLYNFDASSMGVSENMFEEEKYPEGMDYSDKDSVADYKPYEEDDEEENSLKKKNLDDSEFLNKQEQEDDEQLKIIL